VANERLNVAQYVVANLRFLMYGLIIPESMCNPSCYAVLQDVKSDRYSTGPRKCFRIRTFFLLTPYGDFILHFPLDGKDVGRCEQHVNNYVKHAH